MNDKSKDYKEYLFLKDFDTIVETYSKKNPNFFFIQIGANDGVMSDPLNKFVRKFKWKGILIEPQKKEFIKLKKNYNDCDGLIFENLAISDKEGNIDLYKLPE